MRNQFLKLALAIVAFAATPALANELDKPVQVNTSGMQTSVAAQVQIHADESTKALMEYMWFTRRIHHLWLDDVTKPASDAVAANEPRKELRQMATRTTGQR